MIPSEFDGQQVLYVDAMKLQHSGVVVGQSKDRAWLYIQSDHPKAPPRAWHFKVSRSVLPAVLQ